VLVLKIAGGVILGFVALMVIGGILIGSAANDALKESNKGKDATTVVFTVTGSAPNGVDITYGDDSSNYEGTLPLRVSLPVDDNALYYSVNAQLNGSGSITCKVVIGDAVEVGHAVGGYNICSAQLNSGFTGGWG